ncbi:YgjP-like metallopeptidase domain-containing protein [Niveibacterium terrae]|uniref:YgjP-like metallopeptidase domain-containing protein n=1 Tax=Niveibacterium terrae TaxID=3373598 RepID=UPI003A8F2CA6
MPPLPPCLAGYPSELTEQILRLIAEDKLAALLRKKYPHVHEVRSDRALYDYVSALKSEFLRKSEPLSRICWDGTLHVIRNALGTHTTISRIQGGRLKAKREIRVSTLFREAPPEFLKMIVVHELAHQKERAHDKAFYQLCRHMEPAYHQYEFDFRAALCLIEASGQNPWQGKDSQKSHETVISTP